METIVEAKAMDWKHITLKFAVLGLVAMTGGCVTFTRHAVPASRLPHQFVAPSKCNLHPINFQLLSKPQDSDHFLDAGDVLGVTVARLMPSGEFSAPIVPSPGTLSQTYYPPLGAVNAPSYGVPVTVQSDGSILLPEIPAIDVKGLTLKAAAEKIAEVYIDKKVLKDDTAQVSLVLLRSRVNRIVVIREDAQGESANLISKGQAVLHKKGTAMLVDLPYKESDVLHALAASGGLPGVDAYNEIWILRSSRMDEELREELEEAIAGGANPSEAIRNSRTHVTATRLPLKLCSGETMEFGPEDVELHAGDIVYIEPRQDEYFYTGGLLPGGQIPLPRDEDLDILEAIALATGSVGGLGGTSSVAVLRAGAGLGNIIPPTRVLVLRKLPNGQQLPIRVDLTLAMRDPKERIKVMAGDYVMMYYKPGETAANSLLNFFNLNLTGSLD
jgi:hypothetical protein